MSLEARYEVQLDDLYREVIVDHYRAPRNHGPLKEFNAEGEGYNPLCGDELHMWFKFQGGVVAEVGFTGRGCSISQASASMLTERIKGVRLEELPPLIERLRRMMKGQEVGQDEDLGDLEALQGVAKFPVRVKCAALSWNVLEQGLKRYREEQAKQD